VNVKLLPSAHPRKREDSFDRPQKARKNKEMTEEQFGWPRRGEGAPVAVLAHRGGTGPWRENTLEAFTGALGAGADGVELDVRRSADGALVVHHDAEVPGSGAVGATPADALPPWLPTLGDALATCAGALVNVEIKNLPTEPGYDPFEQVATDVAVVLAAGGPAWPAHVVVSSFWPGTLTALRDTDRGRAAAGAVELGLLVHPSLDPLPMLEVASGLGCAALHPHHSQVTASLVARAHDLAMAVVTWTVNLPGDLDAVVAAGVDGVITDRVADTLGALGRA